MPFQRGSDVDQRIERETCDTAAQQVVDARLRLVAQTGGLALRPAVQSDRALILVASSARARRLAAVSGKPLEALRTLACRLGLVI